MSAMFAAEKNILIRDDLWIPEAELSFRYALSGGPGGQHVNKTSSKATLLFDVAHSPSLTEEQRLKILASLAPRIDKDGVLHITSQMHRSQRRNQEETILRLQQLLIEALSEQKERRPTRPSRATKARRLQQKKQQAERKSQRRWNWDRAEF